MFKAANNTLPQGRHRVVYPKAPIDGSSFIYDQIVTSIE